MHISNRWCSSARKSFKLVVVLDLVCSSPSRLSICMRALSGCTVQGKARGLVLPWSFRCHVSITRTLSPPCPTDLIEFKAMVGRILTTETTVCAVVDCPEVIIPSISPLVPVEIRIILLPAVLVVLVLVVLVVLVVMHCPCVCLLLPTVFPSDNHSNYLLTVKEVPLLQNLLIQGPHREVKHHPQRAMLPCQRHHEEHRRCGKAVIC